MADSSSSADPQDHLHFTGHVLHVADASVVTRWLPMLRQTMWALAEGEVRVSLVTNDPELIDTLAGTEVACHWVPQLSGWRAWRLGAFLAKSFVPQPDVLHLWGTAGLSWLQRLAGRQQLPLVVYAFGTSQVMRFARWGLRDNQRLAVASYSLTSPLLARHAGAAERCHTVMPAAALPLRHEEASTGPHTLSVLCASRLDDLDGLRVLVDAVAQLRQNKIDLQVAIVGDGPGADKVWRHIHERRVGDCCVVIDEPRLWEKALLGVDVCVVPACQRDLWLAPLLAMGLGRLVIASRDQIAEWFVDQRTAWQFTPGSAVELAYLLARVTEQPKRVRETCALAADYFYARHAIGDLVQRLMGLYAAATDRRTATAESAPVRGGSSHA